MEVGPARVAPVLIWHNAAMLRQLLLCIAAVVLVPAWGTACSPELQKGSAPKKNTKACKALEQRLKDLQKSKISEDILASAAQVLAEHEGKQWIRLGDWAFTRLEVNNYRHWNNKTRYEKEDGDIQVALETIRGYDRALAERDVELVVVLIPGRLGTDPTKLPDVELPKNFAGGNPGLVQFLLDLNESGVNAIDLGPRFAEELGAKDEDELFLAYDRHWTPRAVALAAEVVAEHLTKTVKIKRGKDKEGRDFILKREQASYVVPPAMPALLPVAEKPIELRFDRVLKKDGTPAYQQDRKSPILVLGDSFSIYYRQEACDFSSRLQAEMRKKLDTIGMRAGASQTVWKNIRRRKDELEGKDVVVWMLGQGLITAGEVKPIQVFPE